MSRYFACFKSHFSGVDDELAWEQVQSRDLHPLSVLRYVQNIDGTLIPTLNCGYDQNQIKRNNGLDS